MFLLPLAIGRSAVGIIISPLVSLMDQQVYIYNTQFVYPEFRQLMLCYQVKQLSDVGVSAVRASIHDMSDIAKAKYRFGMVMYTCTRNCGLLIIVENCSVSVTRVASAT